MNFPFNTNFIVQPIYFFHGNFDAGKELYDSAKSFRLSGLPAFALEHLPNRNSLTYGDLYGISKEASTIYRATLRYEGYLKFSVVIVFVFEILHIF